MMDTTIPSSESGVADATVPQTNTEAVTLGEPGAPVLRPRTAPTSTPQSQTQIDEPNAPADPNPGDNQPVQTEQPTATAEDDLASWAQGQKIDLDNPTPDQARMLAKRLRDTQQRMHEATAKARELETTMASNPNLEYTGNEPYDNLAAELNQIKIQNRVRDFFETHPDAREYETKMAELVVARPWLQNDLEALHALAVNSPDRAAELKQQGGREALTNLAQKQANVPPPANATTSVSNSSEKITPDNVDELVAKNGQEWFKKNYAAINRAMAGTR